MTEKLSHSKYIINDTLVITLLTTTLSLFYRTVREKVKADVAATKARFPHFDPRLAMIQVGDREDSSIYVKMKDKAAKEVKKKKNR